MKALITIVLAIFLMFSLAQNVEAGYKKPPFNGSMFGKRGTSTGKFSSYLLRIYGILIKNILRLRYKHKES